MSKKKDCPPCQGRCNRGEYCRDLAKAKKIINKAIHGEYKSWAKVEWALQVTGDLPSIQQIAKEKRVAEMAQS